VRYTPNHGPGAGWELIFFINNSGYVGEYDFGRQILKRDAKRPAASQDRRGDGPPTARPLAAKPFSRATAKRSEVRDTKTLVDLIEHRKISAFVRNPVYGYLVPDPKELKRCTA